jgi:AraC-like DNA-binding protein/mannose-6-phosphate isomerase-like protein (cupin superfamily)
MDNFYLNMDKSSLKEGFLGQKMVVLPNEIKEKIKYNSISDVFYITDLGYFPKANYHYRKRKSNHGDYIFIYCIEGKGWVKLEGEKTELLPNQYVIIPKQLAHTYKSDENDPWSIYWMHFDGKISENLYQRYKLHNKKNKTIPFVEDRITLFNQIYEIFENSYIDFQLEYANILSMNFISSFIYNQIDTTSNSNKHENKVGVITKFLNDNISKSFKSEDIAKEFNLSSSYIHTLFKKRTGYSLLHFFNLKKIQKACEYLNYTDLSIKEVSHKIGFQDPLYFSRLFKKYMNLSPRAYKNKHGKKS